MVAIEQDSARGDLTVVLRPDLALDWRQSLLIFGVFSATSAAVAIAMTAMGYWPVLPFAGLEICLLGWALYASAQRSLAREVIIIRPGRIEVQMGSRRPERWWLFETYWTEVVLLPPVHRWYARRLLLRSRGMELELGRFLQDEERIDLARKLKRLIGPMAASGERI